MADRWSDADLREIARNYAGSLSHVTDLARELLATRRALRRIRTIARPEARGDWRLEDIISVADRALGKGKAKA